MLLLSDKLWLFHVGLAFQGERASQSILLGLPDQEFQAMGDPNPGPSTLAPL